MKTILTIAVSLALSTVASLLIVHSAGPSSAEVDRDLNSIRSEIAQTRAEIARYSGGMFLLQAQLRLQTLENTEAMLEQKRLSFLRGLKLSYRETTPRIQTDADIARLRDDLAKANAEIVDAEAEAARYAGGMIQSVAVLRAATGRMSAALIEQQIVLSRYGIPLPAFITDRQPSPPLPPGRVTSDKDALQ